MIGIEIVTGDTGHVVGIVGRDQGLVPRIVEIVKEAVLLKKAVVLEEGNHLYIGMYHHLDLNI